MIINKKNKERMKFNFSMILIALWILFSCDKTDSQSTSEIKGYELMNDLNGHWVGNNQTSFGFFEWFAFDFRPISPSHCHSIYEGATNQNIINSVFIADYNGEQKIFARNGGWLGTQYRATYFILDIVETDQNEKYYRLVDAVGGEDRAFIEFRFKQDSLLFDAYKDNSGSLDKPFLHMSFKGSNRNPSYSEMAVEHFNYPMRISEVNFENAFSDLIDTDSALFLEEENDPFPKTQHGYLSDINIDILRNSQTENESLLLYISKQELVTDSGIPNYQNIENTVIRTIDINIEETNYLATYLHPDEYYFTIFLDIDNNGFPSSGDISSASIFKTVDIETVENLEVKISLIIQ